jgi:hypothetical protein
MCPDRLTVAVRAARRGFITDATLHAKGLSSRTPQQEEDKSVAGCSSEQLRHTLRECFVRTHNALNGEQPADLDGTASTHEAAVFLKQCE